MTECGESRRLVAVYDEKDQVCPTIQPLSRGSSTTQPRTRPRICLASFSISSVLWMTSRDRTSLVSPSSRPLRNSETSSDRRSTSFLMSSWLAFKTCRGSDFGRVEVQSGKAWESGRMEEDRVPRWAGTGASAWVAAFYSAHRRQSPGPSRLSNPETFCAMGA